MFIKKNIHYVLLRGRLYPILSRENQPGSYMIRQKKPSLTKIDKKNLRICQLETSGPVGGEIFIVDRWSMEEVFQSTLGVACL